MQILLDLLPPLIRGAQLTVAITFVSAILGIILAFAAGLGRQSSHFALRGLSSVYVEVFRGTSLLVQLFWLFFVFPFFGLELAPMTAGILALGLNCGAYGSEIVRSCILAIPKGQTEAAIALNMTPVQRMLHIILPQAAVMMLPPFGNLLIELLKGTALVSLITLSDLTFQAVLLNTSTMRTTEIFSLLLIMYFAIALPITLGVRWLERKTSEGR